MKTNKLTDTHFHLSLDDDIEKILENAKKNNVANFIISGCDLNGIEEGIKIINSYSDIYLTIGFHPDAILEWNNNSISYLENLVKNNSKIIGIGEIGLDYYHDKSNKEEQKRMFEEQLNLAQKLNLPVVIHSRDAFQDTYDILKKFSVKGIIHCFSGSLETAMMYIKLGYFLGIGGVSTFKNTNLKAVLQNIPLASIVLETDSPYLSPEPKRGQRNEPANISLICEHLSKIKNVSVEEIIKQTNENILSLFKRI